MFYRATPFLSLYWREGHLVAENYQRCTQAIISERTVPLLHALQTEKSIEELVVLPDWEENSLRQALAALVEAELVHNSRDRLQADDDIARSWEAWTRVAVAFHYGTRDLPYVDAEKAEPYFVARKAWQPDLFERKAASNQLALASAEELPQAFDTVLLNRRSIRTYSAEPLGLGQLSTLLRLTWGATGAVDTRAFGRLMLKTSPSGGARHPIEVNVIAQRVQEVEAGVYRYSPMSHALVPTAPKPTFADLSAAFPGQSWVLDAAAIFVMTGVIKRSMWKYPFARAYRILLMDAGHLGQTFSLVATAMGLGPGLTAAFDDSALERIVNADTTSEPAVYVTAVGRRALDDHESAKENE